MAVDVLNLFLIKEKALACVRDELLERKPGRSQRGSGAARWGNVRTSPAAGTRLPAGWGLWPSLPPTTCSRVRMTVPTLLRASVLPGRLPGVSATEGESSVVGSDQTAVR